MAFFGLFKSKTFKMFLAAATLSASSIYIAQRTFNLKKKEIIVQEKQVDLFMKEVKELKKAYIKLSSKENKKVEEFLEGVPRIKKMKLMVEKRDEAIKAINENDKLTYDKKNKFIVEFEDIQSEYVKIIKENIDKLEQAIKEEPEGRGKDFLKSFKAVLETQYSIEEEYLKLSKKMKSEFIKISK